jgi:hypothetical protein
VGEGRRGRVGGVEREPPTEKSGHHPPHLFLAGRPGSGDGALHLGGRHLGHGDARLSEGENEDAAGRPEGDEALRVDARENPLDAGGVGPALAEDCGEPVP